MPVAQVGMTIVLEEAAESRMDDVARSVEQAGVRVEEKLPHLGAIIGVGDASKIGDVSSISGVEHVRQEARFELPPMDESVPQ